MPNTPDVIFTHSHEITKDGALMFKCSDDFEKWPWLALPPAHPIVVQTINYWASVEYGKARGTFDTTKWSALTYSRWQAGPAKGPVTHGLADHPPGPVDDNKPGFLLKFFDASDDLVCELVGSGVVFHTRDFEAWRDAAKEKAGVGHSHESFEYAPASSLGVGTDIERFVSPLSNGAETSASALVTSANGLIPKHPYHSGSGDHVNANHLADTGFQFAHMVKNRPLSCTGGEIKFRHFVELGKPFTVTKTGEQENTLSMVMHQNDKKCTEMTLHF